MKNDIYEITSDCLIPSRGRPELRKLRDTLAEMKVGDSFFASEMTRNNIQNSARAIKIFVTIRKNEEKGILGFWVYRIKSPTKRAIRR